MGGQACVFYGAAQFSKDIDFTLLAEPQNIERLRGALARLAAKRIAVPAFEPSLLERGHAIHFRCHAPGVENLRIDVMARTRLLAPFTELWERRTTIREESGQTFELLAIEDLVRTKKTQRGKDWPMIEALVESHHRALCHEPTATRIEFWFREARDPSRLVALVRDFPAQCHALIAARPLLVHAIAGEEDEMRTALDAEMRAEQAIDRAYWEPVKRELEAMRLAEARASAGANE